MKPSEKRETLRKAGKVILRPQLRRAGSKMFWAIAHYTCGWSNYAGAARFTNQEEAYSEIEKMCAANADFIDDRTI